MSYNLKKYKLNKLDENRWIVEKTEGMNTEGLIYASEKLMKNIRDDDCIKQVVNVAHLPGIVGRSMAMPDIHAGYGFPIGGVAAFCVDQGIISPGGVGYDINCGVRLLRTNLTTDNLGGMSDDLDHLLKTMHTEIPGGLGSRRSDLKLSKKELSDLSLKGSSWLIDRGMASQRDIEHSESQGAIPGANPKAVSAKAFKRGTKQLGTLGSGNHFCEIGFVDEIFDHNVAQAFGLKKGAITVLIHTGSRGFGYQICDDYIRVMMKAVRKSELKLPDRQLCCAPVSSKEGKRYLEAMACAANFAFANRQMITDRIRNVFEDTFDSSSRELGIEVVYDVCHNIAKIERHVVDGKKRTLCVHRKGATRAFPPGHRDLPQDYQHYGQPVLVPGDMGRCSYVLVGTQRGFEENFGSSCHGAGRLMSRSKAKKSVTGRAVLNDMTQRGVRVRASSRSTLAEERPEAYKNVSDVVEVMHNTGLTRKVAKLRPLAVLKG